MCSRDVIGRSGVWAAEMRLGGGGGERDAVEERGNTEWRGDCGKRIGDWGGDWGGVRDAEMRLGRESVMWYD